MASLQQADPRVVVVYRQTHLQLVFASSIPVKATADAVATLRQKVQQLMQDTPLPSISHDSPLEERSYCRYSSASLRIRVRECLLV